jgi:hypothetical protein
MTAHEMNFFCDELQTREDLNHEFARVGAVAQRWGY